MKLEYCRTQNSHTLIIIVTSVQIYRYHTHTTYVALIYMMEIFYECEYFSETADDMAIDHFDVAGVYLPLLESG